MRLDKFLSVSNVLSRSESAKAISRGEISVNSAVAKKGDMQIDENKDKIYYRGEEIIYQKYVYYLMNKPEGVVSATDDGKDKTVIDLLSDSDKRRGLFPCGRLDKYTLGLVIITDNGDLAHRLLSPKHHVKKSYYFRSLRPLSNFDKERLEAGTVLEDGYETKPSEIELKGNNDEGIIVLTEGKYHQIKRMFESVDNKITYLERISFGPIKLDENLKRGEYRKLTPEEIKQLEETEK